LDHKKQDIEVTPEMLAAGLDELYQHHFGEDPRLVLEAVYYAMAYAARERASSTKAVK
jgi:hypothetical protein